MINPEYIDRHLVSDNKTIHEDDLLSINKCIIVLAEPGAGKTYLLKSLARKLNSQPVRASILLHKSLQQDILIIDGCDEIVSIDNQAMDACIIKACEANAKHLIFSSRSSEWDESRNRGLIKDCIGNEPTVVRLSPFDEDEQQRYFSSIYPQQDFSLFLSQVNKLDINPLIGNPLFLKLFSAAYIQSGGILQSKKSIFDDAIQKLSQEHNNAIPQKKILGSNRIISASEEVFTKLLLSGCDGISIRESGANDSFPFLFSIISDQSNKLTSISNSGLFKMEGREYFYEPVHRVIAEYCSAKYLAKRIQDDKDQLTLNRIIVIIAPNRNVRQELRGLLGWMATLGNQEIQEKIIDLDPYAVIANGDPSHLSANSKKRLLENLEKLASVDPFFRYSDERRSFNVRGFLIQEVVDQTRKLLLKSPDTNHLLGLLFELINGSGVEKEFEKESESILFDIKKCLTTRKLANDSLIFIDSRDHRGAFQKLLEQNDKESLVLACALVEKVGVSHFDRKQVQQLLKQLSQFYCYEIYNKKYDCDIKYHNIKNLIFSFYLEDLVWFLDQLSQDIQCVCEQKNNFSCHCRNGISKIITHLMDQYFKLTDVPFDPVQIWSWVKLLCLKSPIDREDSHSVEVLQENNELRQAIHFLAFFVIENIDKLQEIRSYFYPGYGHPGLRMNQEDIKKIVDFSLAKKNYQLWDLFYKQHDFYSKRTTKDELRAHMRRHARNDAELMKLWAKHIIDERRTVHKNREKHNYFKRRQKYKENKRKEKNEIYLKNNRGLIESGRHFSWLKKLADEYLLNSHEFYRNKEDYWHLTKNALTNCISFLEPDLPTVRMIACALVENKNYPVVTVLYAACFLIFKESKTLSGINKSLLLSVRTIERTSEFPEKIERSSFNKELNSLVFCSENELIQFSHDFIEPQLAVGGDHNLELWLVDADFFSKYKGNFCFEMISKYPNMPFNALNKLFDICVDSFLDQQRLKEFISKHCKALYKFYGNEQNADDKNKVLNFWFIIFFVFIDNDDPVFLKYLKSNPDTIFSLENRIGFNSRYHFNKNKKINSRKIYTILDIYIDAWPKIDLPSAYGSNSPKEEKAYRFLHYIFEEIQNDASEESIQVLDKILGDIRFSDFHIMALHMKEKAKLNLVLSDFKAPTHIEISKFFDESRVASVEDLRALMIEKLEDMQSWIKGDETNPRYMFYENGNHVDENTARNRIVDYLRPRLNPLDVEVNIERYMSDGARCDFTASTSIGGRQTLLVVEVKGQ